MHTFLCYLRVLLFKCHAFASEEGQIVGVFGVPLNMTNAL
jgi:hypothetical protein